MNDGRLWRYERKIKEADGVKTLFDMLAASSSSPDIQPSSQPHIQITEWTVHNTERPIKDECHLVKNLICLTV